jgi:omega-hydroxy-beta-dihydromenaquinone-9 sulfotransferase
MTPVPPRADDVLAKPREWAPRLWEGADFFAWLRILLQNNAAVELPYWYIATIVGFNSFTHTCLRWLQTGLHGRRIANTNLVADPIFVLGHWRTGTTLLHELMILDERHASPDTFACFVPNHILLSERFFKDHLRFLMPDKRPMDNMLAGWDRPQEDEFALCLMGQRCLHQFLQTLTYKDPRRLVLKSPPHTARVGTLLEQYPHAKFVHLTRDPYVLFASTVNLWKSLSKKHGLQTPRDERRIEEKVFREFRVITESYLAMRERIPAGNLVELRYEEVICDLVGTMDRVYGELSLGDFEAVRGRVQAYALRNKNYEANKYSLSVEKRGEITARWGDLIAKLGY